MDVIIIGLMAAGIRLSICIALAALGEMISERAGVMNVGLEGIMMFSAFLAAAGAVYTGSPWGGVVIAIAGALMLAAIHAAFTVYLNADQIVSGLALILLGMGLSGVGYRLTIGQTPVSIPSFAIVDWGGLQDIPLLGPILFSHTALVYFTVALACFLAWVLPRTGWGLNLRACGENPPAADAAGINVAAYRTVAILIGGALAGLGGAFLVLAQVNAFVEGMVAGRGFIALACVVFGGWRPIWILIACFGFGLADALQIRLQTWYPGIPYQFFIMMPYVVALVTLVIFASRSAGPAALGIAFRAPRRR
jgi:simple sugar transport system permease protein